MGRDPERNGVLSAGHLRQNVRPAGEDKRQGTRPEAFRQTLGNRRDRFRPGIQGIDRFDMDDQGMTRGAALDRKDASDGFRV